MSNELYDFGRVDLLDAEAIGQPGNRRFRLFALSPRGAASLWLEREQMEALSLALDRMLAEISGGTLLRAEARADLPKPPGAPSDFPNQPDVDFRVAQMTIGFDEEDDTIIMLATPLLLEERDGELVQREDAEPEFSARISAQQATRLTAHIAGALAGGRPRCPLCGQPMEPHHVCVKQNGYHPVELN